MTVPKEVRLHEWVVVPSPFSKEIYKCKRCGERTQYPDRGYAFGKCPARDRRSGKERRKAQ